MTHRLEADSIFLHFGERKILSDIYIKCETGKITGLLGRNGTGGYSGDTDPPTQFGFFKELND